jgi:hypothetical protein
LDALALMELTLTGFLFAFGVPLVLGVAILRLIGIARRTDRVAYFGWAYLGGAIGIAALESLRLLVGIRAEHAPVAWSVVALGVGGFALWRGRDVPVAQEPAGDRVAGGRFAQLLFRGVLALTLVVAFQRILETSLEIVFEGDEAAFWSYRAKLLFDEGGFGPRYARAVADETLPNPTYPLLSPLLQLWVFDCAGAITHVANRFPVQLATLALLLCAAAAYRRLCGPAIAAVLILLLASWMPFRTSCKQANGEALIALCALVAADVVARAGVWPRRTVLGLLSLSVTGLLWSKREGQMLLLIALAVLWVQHWRARGFALSRPSRGVALACLAPVLVLFGTWLHNRMFRAHGSHEFELAALGRIWERRDELRHVLTALLDVGFDAKMCAIPGAFALLVLLHRRRSGARALDFLPWVTLGFVLALIAAMVRGDTQGLLITAFTRVLSQGLPWMCLWIAAVAPEVLGRARTAPQEPSEPRLS